MLEQLHSVYCLLLLFCPVGQFVEFASTSAASCAFRATVGPLQITAGKQSVVQNVSIHRS